MSKEQRAKNKEQRYLFVLYASWKHAARAKFNICYLLPAICYLIPGPFKKALICLLLLGTLMPLWGQSASAADAVADGVAQAAEPVEQMLPEPLEVSAYIGIKLDELIARFGPPLSVYVSRGQELWQDDVVFVYTEGDFYVFKDRVWQLGLKSAYGISVGDSKPVAVLVLGEGTTDMGDYLLYPLPPVGWPLTFRLNFDDAGRVSAMFIYRPDF